MLQKPEVAAHWPVPSSQQLLAHWVLVVQAAQMGKLVPVDPLEPEDALAVETPAVPVVPRVTPLQVALAG